MKWCLVIFFSERRNSRLIRARRFDKADFCYSSPQKVLKTLWFRVSPVMTTSIPLRVYFYHLIPQIALRNLGRKDGEKSVIKLYSNSRKTLINQGFWRLGCAWCFSDFESGDSYSPIVFHRVHRKFTVFDLNCRYIPTSARRAKKRSWNLL